MGVTLEEALTLAFQDLFIFYVTLELGLEANAVSIVGVFRTTSNLASFRRNLLADGVQIFYEIKSVNTSPDIVLSKLSSTGSALTTLLNTNGYTNAVSISTTTAPSPTSAPTQAPQMKRSTGLPSGSVAAAVILTVFAAAVIIAASICALSRRRRQNATFANIGDAVEEPSEGVHKESFVSQEFPDSKHTL